jgi:hypothetical protein
MSLVLKRFDTYRVSYRYSFLNRSSWCLHAGATLLARDAKIELGQAGRKASDSNVGVVPLLNFYRVGLCQTEPTQMSTGLGCA